MRIELGGGLYADVREVEDLRAEDRDAVAGAYSVGVDSETKTAVLPGNYQLKMKRALLCRIITGWNLPHTLPSKRPDSLGKLSIAQEDALFKGIEEHFAAVNADAEDAPDPTAEDSDS